MKEVMIVARLYGKRIMLREYKREDLPEIRKWVNNPEITDKLSDSFLYPHTLNNTEDYLNSMLEGKSEQKGFVIAHKENEAYIGRIDLFRFDWKNRIVESGIVIGNSDEHGKGYGSEAMMILMEFVFERLNLNKLELAVYDFNQKAYKSYIKCGFKEEGRRREAYFINGRYYDTILMGILRCEYEEIKKSRE